MEDTGAVPVAVGVTAGVSDGLLATIKGVASMLVSIGRALTKILHIVASVSRMSVCRVGEFGLVKLRLFAFANPIVKVVLLRELVVALQRSKAV
eukprot:8672429-Pyramimonas_sp.AAC.1